MKTKRSVVIVVGFPVTEGNTWMDFEEFAAEKNRECCNKTWPMEFMCCPLCCCEFNDETFEDEFDSEAVDTFERVSDRESIFGYVVQRFDDELGMFSHVKKDSQQFDEMVKKYKLTQPAEQYICLEEVWE